MPTMLSKSFAPTLRHFARYGSTLASKTQTGTIPHIVDDERGYMRWERYVSRDPKVKNPQVKGDTPYRFLTRRLGHAFEIYPLFGIMAFWVVILTYTVYISLDKIELWIDRSNRTPPWDWERAKDNYYKLHTVNFDFNGKTHQRLEIMERLQNEMLEAAKKRGTR